MKRLLGLILAVSLLLTLALPAAAEEMLPCDTEGCTLELGHGGDHIFPEACQLDPACTGGYNHEGSCSTAEPLGDLPCDEPGCTGLLGHEGSHEYPTHCENNPECILGYDHEGDCQTAQPCDTEGCTLTLGHEEPCTVAAETQTEGIPDGFCLAIPNGDRLDIITAPLSFVVGDSMNVALFYNGVRLTTTDELTVSDGLGMECDGDIFRFPPKKAGQHTITYTAPDGSQHQKTIIGLPDTIAEPAFCYAERNGNGFVPHVGPLRIPAGRYGTVYLFCDGKMLTGADADNMKTSSDQLSFGRNSDGMWWFRSNAAGTYILTYTPEEGQPQTITVEFFDNSIIDCQDFCFAIPGNMGALTAQTSPLSMGVNQMSPFVFLYFGGRKITDADKLTFSSGLTVEVDLNSCYRFRADTPGDYTITYQNQGAEQILHLVFMVSGELYAQFVDDPAGTYYGGLVPLPLTEDRTEIVKFFIKNAQGEYHQIRSYVGGTGPEIVVDNRFDGTYAITVSKYQDFFNYGAMYSPTQFEQYFLGIQWHEATRLVLRREQTGSNLFNYTGAVGDSVTVYPFFGKPSQGITPYTDDLTASAGIRLTPDENGAYTLEILEPGEHVITAQINGEPHLYHVTGIPAASGSSLFALEPNSGVPQFFSAVSPRNSATLRFCYGTYGDYRVLEANELEMNGGPMMSANSDGSFTFRYDKPGQIEVKFTDENDSVHSYVIKAYADDNEMFMNQYWAQQSVIVPGGDYGIRVGFARLRDNVVALDQGCGIAEEDGDIDMLLGALYVDEHGAPMKMVEPSFYDRVTDVRFSILSYLEGDGTCSLSQVKDFIWKDVTMPAVSIHVEEPKKNFAARVLLNFCVDGVRYSREAVIFFEENRETTIEVDITDAKVLNTLLSNPDVLLNWMKSQDIPFNGGAVVLQLPACTYDQVIVPQVFISGDHNSYCPLIIKGAGAGQTIMPGLLSKGGTLSVSGIGFQAKPGVTLPCDGENAACGIMVDTHASYQPQFDAETLCAYHPDYLGMNVADVEAKLEQGLYHPSAPNGNMYCMDRVENCSFDGFQYAVFSGRGGMAAPVQNCVIQNCQYGIYINCANVATHYNVGTKVYTGNTFRNNDCAVRIAALPADLSPYYLRFQDNSFLGNQMDFGMTGPGTYYCYRNYFDDNTGDGPRGAKISSENGMIVVSNPCRITPDDAVNLWIFDTDAQQNTRILRSEADRLLVNPKAMENLDKKLEIPVIDDKENPIGTWIVEGGNAK